MSSISRGYAYSLGIAARTDGRELVDNPYESLGRVKAYGAARAARLAREWEAGWERAELEILERRRTERET